MRSNKGTYCVNVARSDRVETVSIGGVELLSPTNPEDAAALRTAVSEATEVTTCLPSVKFYDSAQDNTVAALIADGLQRRKNNAAIVYAAENHNHAAEILEEAVARRLCPHGRDARDAMGKMPMLRVQFLNTVIGKMSQVVTDPHEIAERGLTPIAPGIDRAFLVEEFNRILVSKTAIPDFTPGIDVFVEKDDLLPFEEAKLYGHNAIHALLGFVGTLKGYTKMTQIKGDAALIVRPARRSCGVRRRPGPQVRLPRRRPVHRDRLPALCRGPVERITNPYLADTTARASRDVVRKLGTADRIFGTMALAREHGIEPKNMAMGALAGIALLLANADGYGLPQELRSLDWQRADVRSLTRLLAWLWQSPASPSLNGLADCTCAAREPLVNLLAQ